MIESKQNNHSTTIFFQSLGCPKNLVDTEVMLGIADRADYKIISDPARASVIVVNTCSFINDSKQESIDTILELAENKRTGNCERLIVTGCLPQRYLTDLKANFPEVDAFVGTAQYANILEYISGKREDQIDFKHPRYLHNEHTPRINSQPFYKAYLKISEGCTKGCSFCIIPKIRGTLRSRTIGSLFEEANRLVDQGAKELNLIAQNLPDYGNDLEDGSNLAKLLKKLVTLDSLEWIRLHYVYPDELSDELCELIASEKKIVNYLDMPIQHINDRLLKLMNRHVTGDAIRRRLDKIIESIAGITLRSTVIAGYPSETETEFKELVDFIRAFEFDHLGAFAYSHEENTASYFHKGLLPQSIREQRRNEIMAVQKAISAKKLKGWVGKTVPVLVEGVSEESEFLWQGRHPGQASEIDGCVLLHDGTYTRGEIRPITIQQSMDYDLLGVPAEVGV